LKEKVQFSLLAPILVKAAIGEVVDNETLGGAKVQSNVQALPIMS